MTTTNTAAPSLIAALHARFEACDAEYQRIEDDATRDKPNGTALAASQFETDQVRVTILTQVPDTWADAAILQYHIRIAHEATESDTERASDEAKALSMAIDTLFDFMASETPDLDHGAIGPEFQRACNDTHFARRHRTGDMI